jgi:HprK-related kinase A
LCEEAVTDGPIRTVKDLPVPDFCALMGGPGVGVQIGPFDVRLNVGVPEILPALWKLYADYPLLEEGERVYSIHARLDGITAWRRPLRRVRFSVDSFPLHEDLPRAQALTVLEWGLNLVIALRFHCFLLLHAAVLERDGRALLLPAAPGHGKSTLCTALAHRGWRLLSDEFGILRPADLDLAAIPRPIPLKNESIEIIRDFAPEAIWGPKIHGTRKGTVAHVAPPTNSVERSAEPSRCRWLVFPRWQSGASLELSEVPLSVAFMRLATNAFNYETQGERGFRAVQRVIASSRCYELVYSNLDEAVTALDRMALSDVEAA